MFSVVQCAGLCNVQGSAMFRQFSAIFRVVQYRVQDSVSDKGWKIGAQKGYF